MTEIEKLDKEISTQRDENVRLYSIFQYRLHEEDMQPIIKKWREGSNRIKQLILKRNLLAKYENEQPFVSENRPFINGYGEATTREIVSSTYKRAEKRLSKQIMNFIG